MDGGICHCHNRRKEVMKWLKLLIEDINVLNVKRSDEMAETINRRYKCSKCGRGDMSVDPRRTKMSIGIRGHCFEWEINLYKLGRIFDYGFMAIWMAARKRNWKFFLATIGG